MILLILIANLVQASPKHNVIIQAAKSYSVPFEALLKIATIESRLKSNAINHNKNGSIDVGMFQINSIHWKTTCKKYNVFTDKGNALCAAKILASHKRHRFVDVNWVARYHSTTPKHYNIYKSKLDKVVTWVILN